MLEALKQKKKQFEALEKELASPELLSDRDSYRQKSKEYADLKEIMAEYEKYLTLEEERVSLRRMVEEEGLSEYAKLARTELEEVEGAIERKKAVLEEMMLTEDSEELKRNAIMEIRAGTGGVEAGLFAGDLYKMYSKYAVEKGWKVVLINLTESELGAIKEVIFSVEGHSVFKFLRFERGTHRVQRVPETEASGRIHTSAATVAVLPEAKDVEVNINAQDLKIDVYRASGAGGQHVNKTESAVRITHLPSGIVVSCQDERSQHKNKAKAMKVLKARLFERQEEENDRERSENRKKQVGSGDRSEKIRTYNFPENRVTDHRINLSLYNLANVLEGNLDELIEALSQADREIKLKNL